MEKRFDASASLTGMDDRRLLLWLVGAFAVFSAAVLWEVLGTVLFAVTVVYAVTPLYDLMRSRDIGRWWAALATTLAVHLGAVFVVAPFVIVLYQRRSALLELLRSVPPMITLEVGEQVFTVSLTEVQAALRQFVSQVAVAALGEAAVLGVKAVVFGMVVFALLIRKEQFEVALTSAVPEPNRFVARNLARRARETILAIYVLQAATAIGTFLLAAGLFMVLGYKAPLVLALLAGVLQFLPVIGPSVLVAALVIGAFLAGDPVRAAYVGVIGWVVIAWLPDVAIRPRLAEWSGKLPGSLYFVGFAGGLLTTGAIGIIIGPLAVALLFEVVTLLADETATLESD